MADWPGARGGKGHCPRDETRSAVVTVPELLLPQACDQSDFFGKPSGLGVSVRLLTPFGLLLTIFGCVARTPAATPYAVGLYITAAYWFTASTSFANPAVTLARALSDTFAGIAPGGVFAFIGAQLMGMLVAVIVGRWLWLDAEPGRA